MAVLLDQFVMSLSESGLMSAEDVQALIDGMPDGKQPTSGEDMAKLLCNQGKLTKFQALSILKGKSKSLILGDYVVFEEIGAGGMGQVFKAKHRRMKRTVALKILPPQLAKSGDAVKRFEQEVEAAARLIHTNIATAFDAGESNGIHFLVMEFLDGKDLGAIVEKNGPLKVADAINYILQAANGLKYAHEQKVVHRDIKPSNLLLEKSGVIKVLDMGLARSKGQPEAADVTAAAGLTKSGDVMGTVDYMSPEQASSTKSVDDRADIYSLGCTLFYILTGKPIFAGDTLVEKIIAHKDAEIPSLTDIRKDVPNSLDIVFRRMVAKKPDYRYRTMADVIRELEKCAAIPAKPGAAVPKPVVAPKKVGDTMAANTQTMRGPAPAPPPPARRPHAPQTRVERAREQITQIQKKEAHKEVWQDAVNEIVKNEQRKKRWTKVQLFLRNATAGVGKFVFIGLLLGGTAFGGWFMWNNVTRLNECHSVVKDGINQQLPNIYDKIPAIEFKDASYFKPVPEQLPFEFPLFQTTPGASRRQTATLRGSYDRTSGLLEIDEPFEKKATIGTVPKVAK